MKTVAKKYGPLLPLLVVAMLLRAFVPAGYMPASPGDGFLFVPCHEMAGLDFAALTQADNGHSTQGGDHHHHGSDAAAADSCSLGHMLSAAFVDVGSSPQSVIAPVGGLDLPALIMLLPRADRYAQRPRGPPSI